MVVPSAMVLRGGDDVPVEDEGGAKSVSCSICLEVVAYNDGRSWAKLQCGHEFHLDCIGSAFNVKGAMQCPNCRKIEKGQWLYANGCRSIPEFSMDDWTHDDDLYDLGYSEMAFHWCPFGQLPRVPSSFEDGDFPAAAMAYHDVVGQHAIFAEHSAISPTPTHPCPYVAYVGPMHPSASSSSMTDGTNNFSNHHWNGGPPTSEVPSTFSFPGIDHHFHHSWEQHHSPPPFSTSSSRGDQQPPVVQRSTRNGADGPRSGSFMHPLFVSPHSSGSRSGSSVASSMSPHQYPGSNARSRDRVQALQAYYQQQQQQQPTIPPPPPTMHPPMMSTTRHRSNGHRGSTSSADQTNGFYFIPTSSPPGRTFQDQENPVSARFHSWDREPFTLSGQAERDSGWAVMHHPAPDPSGPRPVFRPRHGSDRAPSQHR